MRSSKVRAIQRRELPLSSAQSRAVPAIIFAEGSGDGIFLGVEQDCQRLVATDSQIHKEACFQLKRGVDRLEAYLQPLVVRSW